MYVHKGKGWIKKMIQQQWLKQKMKLVFGDYMKIANWWARNDTFGNGRCKFIKEVFSGRENE